MVIKDGMGTVTIKAGMEITIRVGTEITTRDGTEILTIQTKVLIDIFNLLLDQILL